VAKAFELTPIEIERKEFQDTVQSAWGLQPVQVLFTLKDPAECEHQVALHSDVVVRNLAATGGYNNPAYNVNIGHSGHYEGGDIHDNNGVICPKYGPTETDFPKQFSIYPGDSITYQVANPAGTFVYDILVISYYATQEDLSHLRGMARDAKSSR
jgi:hypothetical protein